MNTLYSEYPNDVDCSSTTEKDEPRSGRHEFIDQFTGKSLTFLSKTVEKRLRSGSSSMQNCTGSCLITNAYRSFQSTETAVLAVRNSIVRTIDCGKLCALVLLDLSGCFQHCRSSNHVTGAARSILCWRYGSEVVWVNLSDWTYKPTRSKINIASLHSQLQCATGIGTGTLKIQCLHWRSGIPHRRPSSATITCMQTTLNCIESRQDSFITRIGKNKQLTCMCVSTKSIA